MVLNSLLCADVPLSTNTLTHSLHAPYRAKWKAMLHF